MMHVKEGTLEAKGKRMDYIAFGRGTKPLVMLQGLNTRGIRGAGLMLSLAYRRFGRERRVYVFDRRAALPEDVTIDMLAEDTADAMDAMGLSGADVLGVSQGGMIAQVLAVKRPDLVGRLVLALTASRPNSVMEDAVHTWIALTRAGERLKLVTDMSERMYSAAYVRRYRPLLPLLARLQWPKDTERFIALARACLTCDSCDALQEIRCPVLVIGAEEDRVVTGQASVEMAQRLGCECYLYKHLGHAAYEEAGDFNRRVMDFFRA